MKATRLFEPLLIGNLHVKNRIAMAPMTRGRAGKERIPNELIADYYYQRSSAGLLITEATVISKQGIGWIDSPGMYILNEKYGMFAAPYKPRHRNSSI